ncbi:MAG: carboxyl transferase [Eubacterium sp.]|nr:carboxyl transferase [Eubacterium sp.]
MSDKLTMSASERIAALLDGSSFVEVGSMVKDRATDFNLNPLDVSGDGVITGYGQIDGRLVYVYSQDASLAGGAIGEMHAKKISNIYSMAMKMGAPVIGLIDCAGFRLKEATDSLHSFGALYKKSVMASGLIPQITAVFGNSGGGMTLFTALSDFNFVVKGASYYTNTPDSIKDKNGEKADTSSAEFVEKNTSLVDKVCQSDMEAISEIRNLIAFLPSNNDDFIDGKTEDDLNRTIPGIEAFVDDSKKIIENIADDYIYNEVKAAYGEDITTGFIRLGGYTVAVVANQNKKMSAKGASKAASFVNFADAFNIPVLTITNVSGIENTLENEIAIGQESAKLVSAFANATVPKVDLITGDAFGSAYVMMNSKSLGSDIVYAWPSAKAGLMDPKKAAEILFSEDIENTSEKVDAIKAGEEKLINSQNGAAALAGRGYVDDVIEPDATRKRIIAAFDMLATKREDRPIKKHISF